jgi:hypothetical protein
MTPAELVALWIVRALAAYVACGLVVGLPVAAFGLARIDRAAAGSTAGFRLVVLPGLVALWPWTLRRWLAGADPRAAAPVEHMAHRRAAGGAEPGR